ncbi:MULTISPECIES: hypothetical protein [Pseudomonas syringae group]|uniref:hypothetical protein n=1 Tax=Pseudomonas TaxID=286 RepID=UPI0004AE67E3|nr:MULTISPECIES: hypothetical protein [Pseudomonas syringae group]MCF4984282.1 hypothetical protein [Pseudomonas syringae]MCF5195974.1 hypothetical protein [Pseudomonas syringae]MCF5202753.1 hypothetical protein [Pseudomonas syringae]MCF5207080.1 hypothetical protein [Pseudomonas syringae]MCF5211745.1 hypothetical protein [Pseudomonas syringae]
MTAGLKKPAAAKKGNKSSFRYERLSNINDHCQRIHRCGLSFKAVQAMYFKGIGHFNACEASQLHMAVI